jgi:hypothetical protein
VPTGLEGRGRRGSHPPDGRARRQMGLDAVATLRALEQRFGIPIEGAR